MKITQQIIEVTFEIPNAIDDASALVLQKNGCIGVQMSNGVITPTITSEEFQYLCKRVKEGTSSSYSSIHYGHYKAGTRSIGKQVLHRKSAGIFVRIIKQTTNVSKAIRFFLGHLDTEMCYTTNTTPWGSYNKNGGSG